MANEKWLIDANALIKDISDYYYQSPFPHPGTTWRRGFEFAVGLILKAPTVDAVEVVHGRWIQHWGHEECSLCGYRYSYLGGANYCPNCGAKMDGDGNEAV